VIKLNDLEKLKRKITKMENKIAKMLNVNLKSEFGRRAIKISPPDSPLSHVYLLTINTFHTGSVPISKFIDILNLLKEEGYEPTYIGCYEDDILAIDFIKSSEIL